MKTNSFYDSVVDESLPRIIIPSNKLGIFKDWYNKDLRFQDKIPHSFDCGYMLFSLGGIFIDYSSDVVKNLIKRTAKNYKKTYRKSESYLSDVVNLFNADFTVHFSFNDNMLKLRIYGNSKLYGELEVGLDSIDPSRANPEATDNFLADLNLDDIDIFKLCDSSMNLLSYYCLAILSSALWYLATSTKTTKYYYETKPERLVSSDRNIVDVKKEQYITTPIYDLSKVKIVKLDSLIKHRKGWTYSHAFQVHGHFRHYKSGKVVFVNSYVKGKGKSLVNKDIVLNPCD